MTITQTKPVRAERDGCYISIWLSDNRKKLHREKKKGDALREDNLECSEEKEKGMGGCKERQNDE